MKRVAFVSIGLAIMIGLLTVACTGSEGKQGPKGDQGAAGERGPAGATGATGLAGATGPQGLQGPAGAAGAKGDTGPAGAKGDTGPAGAPGKDAPLPAGVERQIDAVITVSKPANGTHFVVGETPVLTITLKDQLGKAFNRANDFSQLRLMLAGPQETLDTVTAVKLLKTTADRTQSVHHYVDLKTNADVQVSGSTLTYKLGAVSDEKPGTYIASVWGVSKAEPLQQAMTVAEFQVGTATLQKQIVEKEKCAQCHLGADSGKFYFAHSDPRVVGQAGNWALDQNAVRNCKTCHNTDGYSAYRGDINNPVGDRLTSTARTPDPIVRRVHGVHMGEGLKNTFNTDPTTGDFKDYTSVVFPANVKNCTMCHVDDRYKTQPSRLACGACHDNVWFGEKTAMPKTFEAHPGGPQANDAACAVCHPADTGGVKPVAVAHKIEAPPTEATIGLAMSAPANGKFYVAGEKPTISITLKNPTTGAAIAPSTITEKDWNSTRLQVSGPRDHTKPVLTTAAAMAAAGTYTGSYAYNDLRVRTDPAKEDPKATRTATGITYQLDDVAGLKTGTYTVFVQARKSASSAAVSTAVVVINFQVGSETPEKQVATNCTACHGDTNMHNNYPFRLAPDICKNCHDYQKQLTGKTGWQDSNWGFGAQPIVKRVHGLHFGHYLDKPLDVYRNPASFDASEIIFPQDVRNCTKCHTADTTGTWKTAPARLACLACHDKDKAITHATLQITDATPAEPYSGDEVETCNVCHGRDRAFSPDKVHNISNPFKPVYPRKSAVHHASGGGSFVADNGDTFSFGLAVRQLDGDGNAAGQYQHTNTAKGHVIEIKVLYMKVVGNEFWLGGVITRAAGGTEGQPGDDRVIRFQDNFPGTDQRTRMQKLNAGEALKAPKTGNLADANLRPLVSGNIAVD